MTAMRLKRYPSPSGGIALGKMGVGATMLRSMLPAGARWVEYLGSTGTQWIDTGCPVSLDTIYQIKIRSLLNAADNTILAAYASTNPDYSGWALIMRIQRYRQMSISYNSFGANGDITSRTEPVEIELAKTFYSLNGSRVYFSSPSRDLSPYQLGTTLFAIRATPTRIVNFAKDVRMYYFRQLDGEQILRDFRPIAIGTTGYMLDLVSGEYVPYGNKGTGDFVVGPDTNAPVI